MHCRDQTPELEHLSDYEKIIILNKERHNFAKSRQQWIQAAFDAMRGDLTLINKLVEEELCDECRRKY